jgi:hypothetical protein
MWGTVPGHVMRFEFGACHTGVKSCRFCVTGDALCHIISTGSRAVLRSERVPRVLRFSAVDTRGLFGGAWQTGCFVPLELKLAVVCVPDRESDVGIMTRTALTL